MKQTTSIQKTETTMKENQEPVHQSRMNESFFVRRPAAPGRQHAGSVVNAYNLQPVTVKREPAILNHTMFFMKRFLRRGGMFITAFLFANLFFALSSFSQVVVVNPSSPWTVPAGVTSIKVEVWGGGGGGGGAWNNSGSGGGGGAYNVATFSVTPGHTFTITIGSGGAGGSSFYFSTTNGAVGGTTSVSGVDGSVSAVGGNGGTTGGANSGNNGNGGAGIHSGGNGGSSSGNGAGGGGGAGNNGDGTNGSNTSNGIGGAGNPNNATYIGGNGGAAITTSGNGNPGIAPGGGGSGAKSTSFFNSYTGGSGGSGQVVISYCPTITASATKNDVQCFNTSTGQIIVSASGGTAPYTFSINNGTSYQASNTFSGLPIGTYQIRVKDANGCESKSVQ